MTLAALDEAIRMVEPRARLVASRVLRRVIRLHNRLQGFGFRVPHSKGYVLQREPLLEIADRDELGFGPDEPIPPRVILLERPGADEMAKTDRDAMLTAYWRLLLHARVHLDLQERLADGTLSTAEIGCRIAALGKTEFDEIRTVLRQERMLLPPYDDLGVYVEFVAVWLELKTFAPRLLSTYFPAIHEPEAVDRMAARDFDAEQLLRETRLPEAPEPRALDDAAQDEDLDLETDEPPAQRNEGSRRTRQQGHSDRLYVRSVRSEWRYLRWMARAERAAAKGNLAGAAIRHAKAGSSAPRERSSSVAHALRGDIHRLVARLQEALGQSGEDPRAWRESLLALAHQAPRGLWTVEARLLYDLQKLCVDSERELYTVDLVQWVLSGLRQPIVRPLPRQREVLIAKHLQRASKRLRAARISDRRRRQLSSLLRTATQGAEKRLRDQFRPILVQTLAKVDLRPKNVPERVARDKLVEELLDRVVRRGFLRLGDLRDAISRSNLKLPDCAGFKGFLRGDAVLQADSRLSRALDGVYHRGEIYLRWLQQFTLAAFGTRTGRFLTKYVAVPFGGAYVTLAFIDEMMGLFHKYVLGSEVAEGVEAAAHGTMFSRSPELVIGLGLFLFGLFHIGPFRRGVWEVAKFIGRAVRLVCYDAVRWLLHRPLVRQILDSPLTSLAFRYLVKPAVPAFLYWCLLPSQADPWQVAGSIAALFLAMNLVLNSRAGRDMEELVYDWTFEGMRWFGVRFLTGLIALFVDVFRSLGEATEQVLYSVDEWLRFRSGQGRVAMVLKGALGAVWFFIDYFFRFAFNVLFEPQINPIKHFPVVTVSHKVLFTLALFPLTDFLAFWFNLDKASAGTIAFSIIFCIPGLFGFLVWELKENWRLFAANRRATLGPVIVGDHGETMARLLRPGFHSGTIPKRLAKLRRAERKAAAEGSKATRKHREALRHVEHEVHNFVDRELIDLLVESGRWPFPRPEVGEVELATNRVRAAIHLPGLCEKPVWLTFVMASGWMLVELANPPTAEELPPEVRQTLRTALVGLYKMGSVDLAREQIEAALPQPTPPYDVEPRGIVVRPNDGSEVAILYNLRGGEQLVPEVLDGTPRGGLPVLRRSQLALARVEVPWAEWLAAWAEESAGRPPEIGSWRDIPAV